MSIKPHVWRVMIAHLSILEEECEPKAYLILSHKTTKVAVYNELITKHFTPSWWLENIVTSLFDMGEVWFEGPK